MSDNDANQAQSSSSPLSVQMQSPEAGAIDITAAASPSQSQSASKRSRGRPRKYHTDAEREEAKRRYRENHKSKATSGGVSTINSGTSTFTAVQSTPKQQDVDELWEAIRDLQAEVAGLKMQLAQRDAAAAAVAALPSQKRRRV